MDSLNTAVTPSLKALQDQVLEAVAQRSAWSSDQCANAGPVFRIAGSGSKAFYGEQTAALVPPLDVCAHSGIVSYEPTELVVTAKCGTPLQELELVLAQRQQCLAFEPPHFGPHATVGGMVATGLSGPARASVGAVKDFVLGAQLLDGRGQLLNFGGQVMKNVAGYDVSRLLCGSMGALGLVTQVSLKVLPLPRMSSTLRITVDQTQALQWLNQWAGQPLPINASCWVDGVLWLRLSGAQAAVEQMQRDWTGRYAAQTAEPQVAAEFWLSVREQTHSFFVQQASSEQTLSRDLWRLSVASTAQPLAVQEAQLIEWGGALRWLRTNRAQQEMRDCAQAAGGHATLFRRSVGQSIGTAFTEVQPAIKLIQQRLKQQFDPHHVFDGARLGL